MKPTAAAVLWAGLAAAGWLAWEASGAAGLAWLLLSAATATATAVLAYCWGLAGRRHSTAPTVVQYCNDCRQHCRQHCSPTVVGTVIDCSPTVVGTVAPTVGSTVAPTVQALSDSALGAPRRLLGGTSRGQGRGGEVW